MSNLSSNTHFADETKLYRVMPIGQLIDMLISKKNTLVHPTLWEDPYEKLIEKSEIGIWVNSYNKLFTSKLDWERCYAQCWSTKKESDAIWRSFSHNGLIRCAKIRTTKGKLCKSTIHYSNPKRIVNFSIDRVHYVSMNGNLKAFYSTLSQLFKERLDDRDDVQIQEPILKSLLLIKRREFKHEEEVRLTAYTTLGQTSPNTLSYDIQESLKEGLIEEIVLDPWTPDYMVKSYIELLKKYSNLSKRKIKKSKLYKDIEKDFPLYLEYDDEGYIKDVIKNEPNIEFITKDNKRLILKNEYIQYAQSEES